MTRDVGKFMQELRKNKGLTQKELADQIGVSDKTISKWENGNGMPDTSMLLPLCEALEVTVNELLSGERIPSEKYSMKAEENIMALMKENETTKRGNKASYIIGGIVLVFGLVFMAISIAGIHFPIANYIDVPSMLTVGFIALGVVLLSGAREREKVLSILSATIMPIGWMILIIEGILILTLINDLQVLGPNLAVACLSMLYSVLVKIIVEILRMNQHRDIR